MITEIGGTVGDIESLPFLEAIRQFPVDVGRNRCMYIHLTLVPYIGHAGELKTKPTQHSVNELRRIGIQPDMVVCRSEGGLPTTCARRSRCSPRCRWRRSSPRTTSRTSTRFRWCSTPRAVLADQRDAHGVLARGLAGAAHQPLPVREVGRRHVVDPEVLEHEVVHPLGMEVERDLVDVVDVARGDDRLVRQRREQRDLLAHVVRQAALGPAHDHVGLDADAAQLGDGVLRRLGLELARVADVQAPA